jgi:hypothetical protein
MVARRAPVRPCALSEYELDGKVTMMGYKRFARMAAILASTGAFGCGGSNEGGSGASTASSTGSTTSSSTGSTSTSSSASSSSGMACAAPHGTIQYTVTGGSTLDLGIFSAMVLIPEGDAAIGYLNMSTDCDEGLYVETDNILAPSAVGTYDVTTAMHLGASMGPNVGFNHGYVAGFGCPNETACGSGTITVSSIDTSGSGSAAGTFDVTGEYTSLDLSTGTMMVDPTNTSSAKGTWSATFACTTTMPTGVTCD